MAVLERITQCLERAGVAYMLSDSGGFSVWIMSVEDLLLSRLYWLKDSRAEMQFKDVHNLNGAASLLEKQIFLRTYGQDFTPEALNKICQVLFPPDSYLRTMLEFLSTGNQ